MKASTDIIHRLKNIFNFLKEVMDNFIDDRVLKYSASLSYYTVFSIAPILIIIISIAGIFFGRDAVQGQIAGQISGLVGPEAATQIQSMIGNTHRSGNNLFASILSACILIIGATSIFNEIQDSINSIWGLKSKPKRGLLKMVINRLISFSLIISLGFIAMVSLLLDAAIKIVSDYMGRIPGAGIYFVQTLNYLLNFVVISFMFSVIFKVLPDAKIKWRDVIKGAILTAILFIIGREVISFYVAKNNFTSIYGAAASIVIILVWVYYTAVILYFGAEFTKVYSINYGSRILPNDYAVWVTVKEEEQPDKTLDEVKKGEQLQPAAINK